MSQNQDYTKYFYSPTIEDKYNAILDGAPKIDGKNYNLDDIDPYVPFPVSVRFPTNREGYTSTSGSR